MLKTILNKKNTLVAALTFVATTAFANSDTVNDFEIYTDYDSPEASTPTARQRTLQEIHTELYGERLTNPSPESALGKYLKETGANMSLKNFLTAPENSTTPPSQLGHNRLVIAVSEKTFPTFIKLFNNPNMLYVITVMNDPSIYVAYRGKYGMYGSLHDDLTSLPPGAHLMIPIILSDTEASRATKFFNMGRDHKFSNFAYSPWNLRAQDGKPYCSRTEFEGETWLGNMPLGDTRVDSYILPSDSIDNIDGRKPHKQVLNDYELNGDLTKEQEKLVRSVWKVPGHQQLGEMLNSRANRRGEFTNSIWLQHTLLGSQGVDRVPLVFQFVENEKKRIEISFPARATN